MIDLEEAERIASELLGRPSSDANKPWTLGEFKEGWLVKVKNPEGFRGAARTVIERDTGKVVSFASNVPPGRILEEYAEIRRFGRELVDKTK